jgi:hypothetical protein
MPIVEPEHGQASSCCRSAVVCGGGLFSSCSKWYHVVALVSMAKVTWRTARGPRLHLVLAPQHNCRTLGAHDGALAHALVRPFDGVKARLGVSHRKFPMKFAASIVALLTHKTGVATNALRHASWSSSALAPCRTGVSKPSVTSRSALLHWDGAKAFHKKDIRPI